MYKRKTPLDLSCGIRITMEIIGSKWKPCLIDALRETPKRPSQLHREIPETISRVLDQNLRELEAHGIIEKKIYAFDRHTLLMGRKPRIYLRKINKKEPYHSSSNRA